MQFMFSLKHTLVIVTLVIFAITISLSKLQMQKKEGNDLISTEVDSLTGPKAPTVVTG